MESIVSVTSMGRKIKIASQNGCILAKTLRLAFSIPNDSEMCLYQDVEKDQVALNFDGTYFTLLHGWTETTHFVLNYKDECGVVEMCKDFIMFSKLNSKSDGKIEECSTLSCVTIATQKFAIMAGHCLPKGIDKDTEFNVYSRTNVVHKVKLIYIDQDNGDFGILEKVHDTFPAYPMGRKFPISGSSYFVLGIDGDDAESVSLSVFRGSFRNCDITLDGSLVIGCPGTTTGCSGGGVFNQQGELHGIVTGGRLRLSTILNLPSVEHIELLGSKLGEPSFSHIVPTNYIFSNLPKSKKQSK